MSRVIRLNLVVKITKTKQSMDALAYLQLALVYESAEESHSPGMELSLPNSAWIPVLAMTTGLTILGTAPNAVALQRGDCGIAVAQLQQKLKRLGYFPANVRTTGYYGSITEKAVNTYQANMVLPSCNRCGRVATSNLFIDKGHSGVEVAQIQESLLNLGYFNGRITAYYGSYTKAAVIRFQKDHGLLADGIVGPQTRAKLSS